jgi:hypothetical protein
MEARKQTDRQLWDAAQQGRAGEVRGILCASELGGRIDLEAALVVACHNNWPCAAQALLDGKASPHAWSNPGKIFRSAVHAASLDGRLEVLRTIVLAKADVNQACWLHGWNFCPLHYASWKDQTDVVRYLVSAKACPRVVDQYGRTPADLASEYGHAAVVLALTGAARAESQ